MDPAAPSVSDGVRMPPGDHSLMSGSPVASSRLSSRTHRRPSRPPLLATGPATNGHAPCHGTAATGKLWRQTRKARIELDECETGMVPIMGQMTPGDHNGTDAILSTDPRGPMSPVILRQPMAGRTGKHTDAPDPRWRPSGRRRKSDRRRSRMGPSTSAAARPLETDGRSHSDRTRRGRILTEQGGRAVPDGLGL